MAKITQNRPSEKINTGFGQSGKKFCGHKNFANFLKKFLGRPPKFFCRKSRNAGRYLNYLCKKIIFDLSGLSFFYDTCVLTHVL